MLLWVKLMFLRVMLKLIDAQGDVEVAQVTILGESAGSCSVFLQTVSVTCAYAPQLSRINQSHLHIGVTLG